MLNIKLKDFCHDKEAISHYGYASLSAIEEFLDENPKLGDLVVIDNELSNWSSLDHLRYKIGILLQYKDKLYDLVVIEKYRKSYGSRYRYEYDYVVKIARGYLSKDEKPKKKFKAIINSEPTWKYVKQCSTNRKENDCQIWAFAKLLDVTYGEALAALQAEGWSEKSTSMLQYRWLKAAQKLGYSFDRIWWKFTKDPIDDEYKDIKRVSLKNLLKVLPHNGRFLILVRDHALCVVDGVIYDSNATPPYTRIESIYRIKK